MRIPMNSGAFRSDFGRQDPMFSKREVLCGVMCCSGYGPARKPVSRTLLKLWFVTWGWPLPRYHELRQNSAHKKT